MKTIKRMIALLLAVLMLPIVMVPVSAELATYGEQNFDQLTVGSKPTNGHGFGGVPTHCSVEEEGEGNYLHIPFVEWAWHPRGSIWKPIYRDTVFDNIDDSLMRLRHVSSVTEHFRIGVDLMEAVVTALGFTYGSEQSRQLAVARYIYCSYLTAKHVMLWNIAKRLLFFKRENHSSTRIDELLSAISVERYTEEYLATCMKAIAEAEKKNVTVALKCWQEDSRLGFEASMEYVFDREFASWKLNEIDVSLKQLDEYLSSNSPNLLQ